MPVCPTSRRPGTPVRPPTVMSLVRGDRLADVAGREWYFCALGDCDVVYFAEDGATIPKGDVKIRVGVKETDAPHPVCYCFGHTEESIREEIERTGRSTVVEDITARVRAGECRCQTSNPKGSCCLGDVGRVVKAWTPESGHAGSDPAARGSGCCNQRGTS